MGAEWTGRVTIDGADQAAAAMDKVGGATRQATGKLSEANAQIRNGAVAMRSFHSGGMLIAGLMSGDMKTAISATAASMGALKEAFRAAPMLAAIGLITGAVMALGAAIKERMEIPLRAAAENLEKLRNAARAYAAIMGETATGRAEAAASVFVTEGDAQSVEAGLQAARREEQRAIARAKMAFEGGEGRGAEVYTAQVEEARAVVKIWQDAADEIAKVKDDTLRAELDQIKQAHKERKDLESETAKANERIADARALDRGDADYFWKRAEAVAAEADRFYGRETPGKIMAVGEVEARMEAMRLADVAESLEKAALALSQPDAAPASPAAQAARRRPEAEGRTATERHIGMMELFDIETARRPMKRIALGDMPTGFARSRAELLAQPGGFARSKAELDAMRAAGVTRADAVRGMVGGDWTTDRDTGVVIQGEALSILRGIAERVGVR